MKNSEKAFDSVDYTDIGKKPFKVGELVVALAGYDGNQQIVRQGIGLVLDLEWDANYQQWDMLVLYQRTGKKIWESSFVFGPAGGNFEKQ